MPSLDPILEKLAHAQSSFFRAADKIQAEHWNQTPKSGKWSAAQVAAHLMMVERAILGGADRITQGPPKPFPFLQRLHWPLWLVRARFVQRVSSLPLDRGALGNKEEMLAELRAVRERTVAFLEETEKRDLTAYRWRHSALGMLNVYEWFEMLAFHQLRHTKQIKKLRRSFRKL